MQERTFAQRLLHRWLIQYNPFYLLSAALVLYGLFTISGELAHDRSLWGFFAVGGVTELYAFALVGSAALLTRIGLRRPATFVALVAVFYQADVTLGTESFALLGEVGKLASIVWIATFAVKLRALAWALRLKLSRSAFAVPMLGAAGLAIVPQLSRTVDRHTLSTVVALWLFTLGASALWTTRRVTSLVSLDDWGRTVLRRSMLATWALWGCLAFGHAIFWTEQYHLDAGLFVPMALLVGTRWIDEEMGVLCAVLGILGFAASLPKAFPVTAFASAIVFVLHALRRSIRPGDAAFELYRGMSLEGETIFVRAASAVMARQLACAGFALYLCGWSAIAFPHHVLLLDLVLTAAVAGFVVKVKQRVVVVPLVATWAHWSIQSRLVRAPQSPMQWGVTAVSLGFGLLLASLIVSWRLQRGGHRSYE